MPTYRTRSTRPASATRIVSPSTTRTTRPDSVAPGASSLPRVRDAHASARAAMATASNASERRTVGTVRAGAAATAFSPGTRAQLSQSRARSVAKRARAVTNRLGDRRLLLLVDADEAQVVVGDLLRRRLALERAVEEALQGVPPDRAADGEADEALDRRGRAQPLVDLLVAGAAPEQHADDALAPGPLAGLLGQHLRVGALVDALDLPDVDLDAVVLALLDRAAHQLGAQLRVVAVLVAADGLQLVLGSRHQQLEEELAVVLVQPVRQALEPLELALVHLGLAVRVEADEHLAEVGVEGLDVRAEVVVVLEVELVLTGLLGRHRGLQAGLLGLRDDLRAELLVDEHAQRGGVRAAALDGLEHPLVDEVLGVGDRLRLLLVGIALDPEHLLLEGPAMVEGEDVELAVVSERHGHLSGRSWGRCRSPAV